MDELLTRLDRKSAETEHLRSALRDLMQRSQTALDCLDRLNRAKGNALTPEKTAAEELRNALARAAKDAA